MMKSILRRVKDAGGTYGEQTTVVTHDDGTASDYVIGFRVYTSTDEIDEILRPLINAGVAYTVMYNGNPVNYFLRLDKDDELWDFYNSGNEM